MNKIFLEDCRETLKRDLEYDYVWMSFPEFGELGWEPKDNVQRYKDFFYEIASQLKPKKHLVTVATTDRKSNRQVYQKHVWFANIMEELGYPCKAQQIWHKGRTFYTSLDYLFVQTFGTGSFVKHATKYGNSLCYDDIWACKPQNYKNFRRGVPEEVIERCLYQFTREGDTVFNPMMGAGTCAVAAVNLSRNYIGAEIDEEIWKLSQERLTSLMEFFNEDN